MNPLLKGYSISGELYCSSELHIHRAIRLHDQKPVLLKILPHEYPPIQEINRFKYEQSLLQRLESMALSKDPILEQFEHSAVLILEDQGGIP